MKIVLTQSLPGRGVTGDILDVSDAYARNYLLPHGLAQLATAAALAAQARQRQQANQQSTKDKAALEVIKRDVSSQTLAVTAVANDQGKLFAGLKMNDIRTSWLTQYGGTFPVVKIVPDHLKTTGQHTIAVSWSDGSQSEMTIVIDRQNPTKPSRGSAKRK